MMLPLLGFTILVILRVVACENHDVNSQTHYKGKTRQRSVEATTLFPPDPQIKDEGLRLLLSRLEDLCTDKLEYLITDTNRRFLSLENQSLEVHSTVGNIVQNNDNLEAKVENLGKEIQVLITDTTRRFQSLENQSSEVHSNFGNIVQNMENLGKDIQVLITDTTRRFQSMENQSSEIHSTVGKIVQNNDNLDVKMDNLGKDIQVLMNSTKNLPSDVDVIKQNVSSLIMVTRSVVDSSPNLVCKQICDEGLQQLKDLKPTPATSCPLNITMDKQYQKNCIEVRKSGEKASGIYKIQPDRAPKPFEVVCDLETRGGGWTVIQRRFDGSQAFNLGWEDFKNGFGNLRGEFWLGLENIHILTGFDVNELLIELGNFQSQNKSALYSQFSLGSELEGYSLKILSDYSGDAGDSLTYNIGRKFTTKDKDQDSYGTNCFDYVGGAWWHHSCTYSNLNGEYFDRGQTPPSSHGIFWQNNFNAAGTSLKYTRMLVRPKV